MANTMLMNNAERLGIRDTPTLQKAETFLRILNTKPAAKAINDVARLILCLDLSASQLGIKFDKEVALKLTGFRRSVYQNNLNNVEKILNLDKPVTVSELCVLFDCTEAKELAEIILQNYQQCDSKIKEIGHPQYVAAAVYTSCKINGVKISKSQMQSVSRLKVTQWNELIEEFNKFSSSLDLKNNIKSKGTKKKIVEEQPMEFEDCDQLKCNQKDKEEVIEEYDVWRERILREASAEILQSELNDIGI